MGTLCSLPVPPLPARGWKTPSVSTLNTNLPVKRGGTGGPGTHITQCRPLATSSWQRRSAWAIRSVWCTAPTALCKAKGLDPMISRGPFHPYNSVIL